MLNLVDITPANEVAFTVPFRDAARTWAVVIGINSYRDSPLEGAKYDATNIHAFLVDRCHVPKNNVICLLDTDATRNAIINALVSLRENCAIARGDAIIIYYAGHGCKYHAAEIWPDSRGVINAILPVDRGNIHGTSQVPDISDREINLILEELAGVKGNNVTLIFDCCYSGSMTRGSVASNLNNAKVRRTGPLANVLYTMLQSAAIRHDESIDKFSPERWKPNLSSHVAIAACQGFEVAEEDARGGKFTSALLNTLQTQSLASASYMNLLSMLQYPDVFRQSPEVVGLHKDCLVFQIPTTTAKTSIGDSGSASQFHGSGQKPDFSIEHSSDKLTTEFSIF